MHRNMPWGVALPEYSGRCGTAKGELKSPKIAPNRPTRKLCLLLITQQQTSALSMRTRETPLLWTRAPTVLETTGQTGFSQRMLELVETDSSHGPGRPV